MGIRSGYKITELGEIPDEWRISTIGDECIVGTGGTPSTRNQAYYRNGTIPWLTSTELNFGIITSSEKHITEKGLRESNARIYPKGSLLIAMIGLEAPGTRGRCAILGIDAATSQSCAIIQSKGSIHLRFLFYFYQSLGDKILALAEGTKRQGLNLNRVRSIKIPVPSCKEQQKIAYILSLVDNSIKKSDEIVAKTQQLKKGLVQQLLTRGIGHTRFKQTELGEIPEDWDLVSLADVSHKIIDIDHKMPQKTKEGVPFISIKYLLKNVNTIFELDEQDEGLEFISETDYVHYSKKFNAEYEDILYTRFGTIGNAKLIHTTEKIIASYSIALIKPKKEIISPLFLAYLLNSDGAKKQASAKTKGSTNQNLHLSEIKTITLPLPPRSDQNKITSILLSLDQKIDTETQRNEELQRLKRGLASDLLTGKVRIKVT